VQKWFTACAVYLPYAKGGSLIKKTVDGVCLQKFQRMICWATGNKAMYALQIAEGPGQLEPERPERDKRGLWCVVHGSPILL
jgi:hypothetical protein